MVRNTIKTLLLSSCILLMSSAFGQDTRGQKVQQLRIAYITDQLDLTVEEGQQFWPLFNTFHKEKKRFEKEIKKGKRSLSESSEIADSDLEAYLSMVATNKAKIVELENEFLQACLPILGSKRTLMLMNLEDRFRKRLIEEKLRSRQQKSE